MWPFLPKKCDCSETPTNPGTLCDPNSLVTGGFVYDGPDLPCIGVHHNDDLTTALQELDYYLCSAQFAEQVINHIHNDIVEYPDFVTLVNGAINCETISNCGPSTSTTTSTSTSSSTTTTTTTCHNANLAVNGTFDSTLSPWNLNILPNGWVWSSAHGGSANYRGRDEHTILYQSILTPGVTYDITFDLWCDNLINIVKVFAGTTEYSITNVSGYIPVNIILTCADNSIFGFQGFDETGDPYDTIYIDNVNVSVHCPQFTTTTTTTVYVPCNCFEVFANDGDHVTYTDCNGDVHNEFFVGTPSAIPPYIGDNSKLYCAQVVSVLEPYFVRDYGLCSLGSYCNPTTTTTTTINCRCITFFNGEPLTQEIQYTDCSGVIQNTTILPGNTDSYCGCCGVTFAPLVIVTVGDDCILGECPPTTTTTSTSSSSTTTTTTTEAPPLEGCYNVTFDATSACTSPIPTPGHATIEFTDCTGIDQSISIPLSGTQSYCVLLGPTSLEPAFTCGIGTVTISDLCR